MVRENRMMLESQVTFRDESAPLRAPSVRDPAVIVISVVSDFAVASVAVVLVLFFFVASLSLVMQMTII